MKAKKRLTIAAAVFIGINLLLFVALFAAVIIHNNDISNFIIEEVAKLGTDSDIGYWLDKNIAPNMGVIILSVMILVFLFISAKAAILYRFIIYAKFGIKDFYTHKSKYAIICIFQLFLIGSFFAMLMGLIALVVQKAMVTPQKLEMVLNDTWSDEEILPSANQNANATANNNRPVVRVGPNAKFVENISQLRDSARYLEEAGLISKGQRNALNKKIDKLSKDKARKKEMQGKWKQSVD